MRIIISCLWCSLVYAFEGCLQGLLILEVANRMLYILYRVSSNMVLGVAALTINDLPLALPGLVLLCLTPVSPIYYLVCVSHCMAWYSIYALANSHRCTHACTYHAHSYTFAGTCTGMLHIHACTCTCIHTLGLGTCVCTSRASVWRAKSSSHLLRALKMHSSLPLHSMFSLNLVYMYM